MDMKMLTTKILAASTLALTVAGSAAYAENHAMDYLKIQREKQRGVKHRVVDLGRFSHNALITKKGLP